MGIWDIVMRSWVYIYSQPLPNMFANSGAVMDLCKALLRTNVPVTLGYSGDPALEPEIRDAYELPDSLDFVNLPDPGGVLGSFVKAAAARSRCKGDVFVTRVPKLALALALTGKPTILELHQHMDTFTKWTYWRRLLHFIRKDVLAIATLTDSLAIKLDPLLARTACAISTIPSGASNFDLAHVAPQYDVGYLGSFVAGKGIERVHELAVALPQVRFVVYGDATRNVDCAHQLGALPNVTLGGFVPRKDIADALSSFRIGLAPYSATGFGGKEGPFVSMDSMSSLKIVEYMSASRAIVSSRIPSVEAVVRDEDTALLCQPDDLSQWKAAIARLVEDRALSAQLSARARAEFLEKYDYDARAKAFDALAARIPALS